MSRHENFFSTNVQVLKLSGLWLILNEERSTRLYVLYSWLTIIICQLYHHPSEYYILRFTYSRLDDLVEQLGMLLTHLMGCFKILFLYFNRKKIISLMQDMQNYPFRYDSTENFDPNGNVETERRLVRRATLLFLFLATGVPVSKTVPALFHLASIQHEDLLHGNVTCYHVLPYFSWIPFPSSTKVSCTMAILFQNIPMILFAWQITALDGMFACFLTCLKSHLVVLKGAFEFIRPRCLNKLDLPKDYEVIYDIYNPELNKEMVSEIRQVSIHLQTIIKFAKGIEDIYTFVTLMQVLLSTFVAVSCLYMASSEPAFSGTFNAEIEYFAALITQLTLYCWFGNEITIASATLPQAIYHGNWISASENFKRSMLINMIRMNKPIYITIGKFSPLTLATLVSILRGSYSYFAVLNKNNN